MPPDVDRAGPPGADPLTAGDSTSPGFRHAVDALTEPGTPRDALTRHFLLAHPISLSRRYVLPDGRGVAAVCRTSGGPLPLVVFRCRAIGDLPALLAASLDPVARHYIIARPDYREALLACLADPGNQENNLIHTVTEASLRGEGRAALPSEAKVRVLSRPDPLTGADGWLGQVTVGDIEVSSAHTQWSSDGFAEIGVVTWVEHRRHGYGRAAVVALSRRLVDLGLTPLYIADRANQPSLALAASTGFQPTEDGEFTCAGLRPRG